MGPVPACIGKGRGEAQPADPAIDHQGRGPHRPVPVEGQITLPFRLSHDSLDHAREVGAPPEPVAKDPREVGGPFGADHLDPDRGGERSGRAHVPHQPDPVVIW